MAADQPTEGLRVRRCCDPTCNTLFNICASCDRGQRYCSNDCRKRMRQQKMRASGLPIPGLCGRQAKSLPASTVLSATAMSASRDASGSCFDHDPGSDSTNQPFPVLRLRSRESLDQPIRRASAPSTSTVGEAFKFLRFQMIANTHCGGSRSFVLSTTNTRSKSTPQAYCSSAPTAEARASPSTCAHLN